MERPQPICGGRTRYCAAQDPNLARRLPAPPRFITVGLNDVRIGDDVIAGVRFADVLAELAKLKPSSSPYRGTPQGLAPVNGANSNSRKWHTFKREPVSRPTRAGRSALPALLFFAFEISKRALVRRCRPCRAFDGVLVR